MEEIRVVELPGFRYLNFNGFGSSPELQAISQMQEWLEQNKPAIDPGRFFGFNNPDPAPGSENYGYEIWIEIPAEKADLFPDVKTFSGGMYAVLHCGGLLADAENFIPSSWKSLTAWLESSPYRLGRHQWLEEQLGDGERNFIALLEKGKISLDLYMPIAK